VLIPGGWLGLLPLHGAWRPDETKPTNRRYALDEITFTYAPSARALMEARQQAAARTCERLLAVDNPDGTLRSASAEIQAALSHFPAEARLHLPGKQAARETVRREMDAYDVLHFSTHGHADFNQPLQSGLLMAEGEHLTLEDLFALRPEHPRLAILSACETGVPSDLENLDEVVSLPSGWMQAGIPGVVGTLWSVNDLSTAMLITLFYDFWREKQLPAPEALRQAQIWLRDLSQDEEKLRALENAAAGVRLSADQADALYKLGTLRDFSHPFYWAAFTYTGI